MTIAGISLVSVDDEVMGYDFRWLPNVFDSDSSALRLLELCIALKGHECRRDRIIFGQYTLQVNEK